MHSLSGLEGSDWLCLFIRKHPVQLVSARAEMAEAENNSNLLSAGPASFTYKEPFPGP